MAGRAPTRAIEKELWAEGFDVVNEPGAFCWGQLNTKDTTAAEAFSILFE